MRDLLVVWTFNTIKDNPTLHGGDDGNSSIMKQYLIEVSDNGIVSELTTDMISSAVSVSRLKNALLTKHRDFDHRVKNKATGARLQKEQLFTARELMTPKEAKIVKYLDANNAWSYTASRIKKSVRSIDLIDIECVLRNKNKYQTETSFNGVDGVYEDTGRQKKAKLNEGSR